MAFSYVDTRGDGSTVAFTVPFPYIAQKDVKVTVGGVATPFTWANQGLINITPAPAAGSLVRVYRETEKTERLVDFEDDSIFDEALLDTMNLQLFYIAQETLDFAERNADETDTRVTDFEKSVGVQIQAIDTSTTQRIQAIDQSTTQRITAARAVADAAKVASDTSTAASAAATATANAAKATADTAIKTAGDAEVLANSAIATSNSAFAQVGLANKASEQALQVSQGVDGKASQALDIAQGIESKADLAMERSAAATSTANAAKATAEAIDGKASQALQTANTAQGAITQAVNTANEALAAAEEILETANAYTPANKAAVEALKSASRLEATESRGDTTLGRALRVGDFGVGKALNLVTPDLNQASAPGLYYCNSPTNAPTNDNGYLLVEAADSAYFKQTYTIVTTNRTFTRQIVNGTPNPWVELALKNSSLAVSPGTLGSRNRIFMDSQGASDASMDALTPYLGALEIREVDQVTNSKGTHPRYRPGLAFHWGALAINRLTMDHLGQLWWGGDKVLNSGQILTGYDTRNGAGNPVDGLPSLQKMRGLFGATQVSTGGNDWNSQVNPGVGDILMRWDDANGPGWDTYAYCQTYFLYDPFSSSNSLTQTAISYSAGWTAAQAPKMAMRGRYDGKWTPWKEVGSGSSLTKETYYSTPGAFSHTMQASTASYEVEVWGGGGGGGRDAGNGGNSTFGGLTAYGGAAGAAGYGGVGGGAENGLLNLTGQAGSGVDSAGYGAPGGSSPRGGGGGRAGAPVGTPGGFPGGGGGSGTTSSNNGGGGGYVFDRKATVGGTVINGTVGAGGAPANSGFIGGGGLVIVREYSGTGVGIDNLAQLTTDVYKARPQKVETLWSGNVGNNGVVLTLSRPLQVGDLIWVMHADSTSYITPTQVITSEILAAPGRNMVFNFGNSGATTLSITNSGQITTAGFSSGYPIARIYASKAGI